MAGRFEFESPGATATATITKLLAERKAEERQRLLDSLSFSADQRAQDAAALNKRQTEAQMASQQQQNELAKVAVMGNSLEEGENPEDRFKPEDIAIGAKYGLWKPMPRPSVSTEITGMTDENKQPTEGAPPAEPQAATPPTPPKPTLGYVGSVEQRKHRREQIQTAQMIGEMMQDPKQAEIGALMKKMAEGNDGVLPPDFYKVIPYNIPVSVWDEPNNQVVPHGNIPSNTQILTRPHPPASYANSWDWKPLPGKLDANGNQIFTDRHGNMKTNTDVTVAGPEEAPLGINQNAYDTLVMNTRMLKPDEAGKVDPGRMLAYRQVARQAISASRVKPVVKQLASEFLVNPDQAKLHASQMRGQLSPDEANDLQQIIQVIGGGQIGDILRRNPEQQFNDHPPQPLWKRFFGGF